MVHKWHRSAALLAALPLSQAAAQAPVRLNTVETFGIYRPDLVKIETAGGPDNPCRSEGTGFIIGRQGTRVLVATAAHVIPAASECARVQEITGRPALSPGAEVPLTLVQRSGTDVAILAGEISDFGPAAAGACMPRFGTPGVPPGPLTFIGYFPGDTSPLPYEGRMETPFEPPAGTQRIQGSINHGISGAPVFDELGRVIGMVRERVEKDAYGNDVVGKGLITPVPVLVQEIDQLHPQGLGDGRSCIDGAFGTAVGYAFERDTIEIPVSLSEINSDHPAPAGGDVLGWLDRAISGGKPPPPLRYAKKYERSFEPQPGYRFVAVTGTRVISHNFREEPLPTTACTTPEDCIRIEGDGRRLVVRFRLFSGPSVDQTRGWLDMVILTRQQKLRLEQSTAPRR